MPPLVFSRVPIGKKDFLSQKRVLREVKSAEKSECRRKISCNNLAQRISPDTAVKLKGFTQQTITFLRARSLPRMGICMYSRLAMICNRFFRPDQTETRVGEGSNSLKVQPRSQGFSFFPIFFFKGEKPRKRGCLRAHESQWEFVRVRDQTRVSG